MMQNSKTSYIDRDSSVDKFYINRIVDEDIATTSTDRVVSSVDGGQFGSFLKRITPEKGKVMKIKTAYVNIGVELSGTNDADEDTGVGSFGVYLYRRSFPTISSLEQLNELVENEELIPIVETAPLVPTLMRDVLSGQVSRIAGSQGSYSCEVMQYCVQPCGIMYVFSVRRNNAADNVTFTVTIGTKVRYSVESKSTAFMKKLFNAYTSIAGIIEKRS